MEIWNRYNNKPCRCEQHSENCNFTMYFFMTLTNFTAKNNCIKIRLLFSEQNVREMALLENAARNGTVSFATARFVYHHDSKKILVFICLLHLVSHTLCTTPRTAFKKVY